MTITQKIITPKEWVECWKRTEPLLEALRDEDIRRVDTVAAIEALSDAFEGALMMGLNLRSSSGLVDFYRIAMKMKRRV